MRMTVIENGVESSALSLLFHRGTARKLTAAVAATQTESTSRGLLTKPGVHHMHEATRNM